MSTEQITDLMHDPRIKDVDVLQAARTILAERGQDTESLSVGPGAGCPSNCPHRRNR